MKVSDHFISNGGQNRTRRMEQGLEDGEGDPEDGAGSGGWPGGIR